jgi:hypothetical protein
MWHAACSPAAAMAAIGRRRPVRQLKAALTNNIHKERKAFKAMQRLCKKNEAWFLLQARLAFVCLV